MYNVGKTRGFIVREPMIQEAYDSISSEFQKLNGIIKPQVNKEKQVAAEQGDRSENAEYHAAKEKLRHIDKRLKYLSKLLNSAQIIDPTSLDHSKICFGSSVLLEDLDSQDTLALTITGILESEPENGIISFKSPIARALMGKREGDEIKVHIPNGNKEYEILEINYIDIMHLKKEPFFVFKPA